MIEVALAMLMLVTSLVFITIFKYKFIHRIKIHLFSILREKKQSQNIKTFFLSLMNTPKTNWISRTSWSCSWALPSCPICCKIYWVQKSRNKQLIMWIGKMIMKASVTRWKMFLSNLEWVWEDSHWLYSFSVAPNIPTLFRNVQIIWFVTWEIGYHLRWVSSDLENFSEECGITL